MPQMKPISWLILALMFFYTIFVTSLYVIYSFSFTKASFELWDTEMIWYEFVYSI